MGRIWKSRTVRDVLDDPGCDEQFEGFARTLLSPPRGVTVKKPTPEELAEIRSRLDRIQRKKGRSG